MHFLNIFLDICDFAFGSTFALFLFEMYVENGINSEAYVFEDYDDDFLNEVVLFNINAELLNQLSFETTSNIPFRNKDNNTFNLFLFNIYAVFFYFILFIKKYFFNFFFVFFVWFTLNIIYPTLPINKFFMSYSFANKKYFFLIFSKAKIKVKKYFVYDL